LDLFEFLSSSTVSLHGFFNNFADRAGVVDQRLLFEVSDCVTRRDDSFAVEIFVDAREDSQQRRLSGTVEPMTPIFAP